MENDTPAKKQIGTALMSLDGTIILRMSNQEEGLIASGTAIYETDDPHYASVLAHLGAISPGQVRALMEFRH